MTETPSGGEPAGQQRATSLGWLELFFDLVVVVAIALLADVLREDPSLDKIGLFVLLYLAIWSTWVSYVLYANVAGSLAHTRTLVIGMGLIALMAAAIPLEHEARANLFATAFIIARAVALRSSMATGRLLSGWGIQTGGLLLPWIWSHWVDEPWKYVLWAVGLAFDIVGSAIEGRRDPRKLIERMEESGRRRDGRTGGLKGSRKDAPPLTFTAVDVDITHLDDRLGVFVIIVLGEAVTQVVHAAYTVEYERPVAVAALAAFAMLLCLWGLTFSYGFAAAPLTRIAHLPPAAALPIHLVTTGGIVSIAVCLGELVAEPTEHVSTAVRWLGGGGLTAYFLATLAGAVLSHTPWRWIAGWGVPCALAAVALGVFGGQLTNAWLAVCFVVPAAWQVLYGRGLLASLEGEARRRRPGLTG